MIPKSRFKYWEFFVGTLRLETPLHIASAEITLETDSALLKTATGRFYIPGTSIAGALKARAQELFDEEDLINLVFGFQDKDKNSLKSRLFIEDACAGPLTTSLRDGIAVDRSYGSACQGAKYDLEITPKDLEVPLTIKLEIRDEDLGEKMSELVFGLMEELREGRIKLGAGKSRGLGRCVFDYTLHRLNFGDPAQVLDYLCRRDINQVPEIPHGTDSNPKKNTILKRVNIEELDCSINMEVANSPFLIKDGGWNDDFDAVFAMCREKNGSLRDYIPGSSIKGVIRAHAEKVMRTLEGNACNILNAEQGCNTKVKKALETKEQNGKKLKEEDRIMIIKTNSCPICRLFGNTHLAGRILYDDAFFDTLTSKKKLDHVAIDRFTGGAMEGKLFNEQPVTGGSTRLRFSIRNPTVFDKCLLAFLLRDLMEGFPPICFGYGKTRGYGRLKFMKAAINGQEIEKIEDIKQAVGIESTKNWWKEEQLHA